MRLNQLEYFVKTVECGSITKASKELYISQPALTKAISALEHEFSSRLVERTPRGILVTPAGRDFYTYAKEVIASSRSLQRAFGQPTSNLTNHLRVSSQQLDFVFPLIEQTYRDCPTPINIELIEAERSVVVENVRSRQASIGLLVLSDEDTPAFRSLTNTPALEVHPLARSGVYVTMSSTSPLYNLRSVTTTVAKEQLHVMLDVDRDTRSRIYTQQLTYNINNQKVIFCNTVDACLYFMRKTGAIMYTPKWVTGRFQQPDIRSIPLKQSDNSPYPNVNQLVWIKRESEIFTPLELSFLSRLTALFPQQ